MQAAQQVLDLPGGLPGAGGGGGPLGIDQGGPRGAQVPERGGELVLPAGDGLAGAVAAAGVMMNVAAFRGAFGVRAGIGGGVDREPQPPPPRARLPDLRGVRGRQAGQGLLQQPVVDPVVSFDPGHGVCVSSAPSASSSLRPAASASYSAPWPRRNSGTSDSRASEVTA